MRRAIFIVILSLAAISITGCRSVRYIPVTTVARDTVFTQSVRRDSIVRSDSVFIVQRRDTLLIREIRNEFRDRIIRDTVYRASRDTVPQIVEVERPKSLVDKVTGGLQWLAVIMALILATCAIFRARK